MKKRLRLSIPWLLVLAVCSPEWALACEKCFGAGVDTPVTRGIGLAMLSLLVLTVVVWGGIVSFFGNMERRGRMLASGELVVLEGGGVVSGPVAAGLGDPTATLDALLDKIGREGYDALTTAERDLLATLSH